MTIFPTRGDHAFELLVFPQQCGACLCPASLANSFDPPCRGCPAPGSFGTKRTLWSPPIPRRPDPQPCHYLTNDSGLFTFCLELCLAIWTNEFCLPLSPVCSRYHSLTLHLSSTYARLIDSGASLSRQPKSHVNAVGLTNESSCVVASKGGCHLWLPLPSLCRAAPRDWSLQLTVAFEDQRIPAE